MTKNLNQASFYIGTQLRHSCILFEYLGYFSKTTSIYKLFLPVVKCLNIHAPMKKYMSVEQCMLQKENILITLNWKHILDNKLRNSDFILYIQEMFWIFIYYQLKLFKNEFLFYTAFLLLEFFTPQFSIAWKLHKWTRNEATLKSLFLNFSHFLCFGPSDSLRFYLDHIY